MILAEMGLSAARAGAADPQIRVATMPMDASARFIVLSFQILSFGLPLVLVVAVAVLLDVLIKLRAEGLDKEEADKAGSSDLASTSAEDLCDRVDDRQEGDEGEDDDEHDDGGEGFHCSDCLSVRTTRVRGYRVEVVSVLGLDVLVCLLTGTVGIEGAANAKEAKHDSEGVHGRGPFLRVSSH